MNAIYRDRADAGRHLAALLLSLAPQGDTLVLGLPRGGVPVAYEIARARHCPLDVFLVRKLGVPGREELAFGAIASGGTRILNQNIVESLRITPDAIAAVTAAQERVLRQREQAYRGGRPPIQARGRTVILVDDGMATGATMLATVTALRQQAPARLIAAVPVAAAVTCQEVAARVDRMVCAATPDPFYAVGLWYDRFDETSDDEIRRLLSQQAGV
jgi:predicted phosphoribosyltransferase